nr:hypothetical protein [Tanacetum cinerariifolium]
MDTSKVGSGSVNLDGKGMTGRVTLDGSPMVGNSSLLASPTTINMPRGLYSIDVAATFEVPLTTVGDLHKLINDIEAGKHDELLSGMTNDDRMETMDAIDDSINLIVDESTIPSDLIVQSVDINTKLLKEELTRIPIWVKLHDVPIQVFEEDGKSSFARCLIEVNSEANLVDVVTIGIQSLSGDGFTKETIRVVSPIVTTSNVVTPIVEKTNDGYQTVGKKKKMKGKSKSTNGGQFVGPSVKQNVRYEPKTTTSAPNKGVTNVGNASQSASMLKTTDNSSKKDNLSMSNSFSALNDEEDVQDVYDESANLLYNTKTGGSSSFMATAG